MADKEPAQNTALDSAAIRVTLDLGEIELSARELITLREGSVITFEKPNVVEGMLRIAGRPWAKVNIEVQRDTLTVRVTELCALGPVEKNISKDTQLLSPIYE